MNSNELWQVEVDDRVYEASIEEVIDWIHEGSVMPNDRIRRGSLRWLPAERVPELYRHFYPIDTAPTAFEQTAAAVQLVNTPSMPAENEPSVGDDEPDKAVSRKFCRHHRDVRAVFTCGTCGNSLCDLCPNRFGTVRLCPTCGGMCLPFSEFEQVDRIHGALNKPYARKNANSGEFRAFFDTRLPADEILRSLVWPSHHIWDLAVSSPVYGALLFGIGLSVLGGISSLVAAILAFITLSVFLFETFFRISNPCYSDKAVRGFLPRLDFASLKRSARVAAMVLLVSFGPFATLMAVSGIYAWYQFSGSAQLLETEMRSTEERTARFMSVNELRNEKERFEKRVVSEREIVLNSLLGREHSFENPAITAAVSSFMRLSVIFLLPVGLTLILGLTLFPAACGNALDAETVKQMTNPFAVLRVFRRLGFDYFKILMFCMTAAAFAVIVAATIILAGDSLEMPLLTAVATFAFLGTFTSYFWSAFSRLLSTTAGA